MNKREFIIQYVMNRACAVPNDLDGRLVVNHAAKVWETIEMLAPTPTFPPVVNNRDCSDIQRL